VLFFNYSVKVNLTFRQNQTLPPYFGQHALLIGKQMITGDQGTDAQLAVGSKQFAVRNTYALMP
jgi:hypothetical protein